MIGITLVEDLAVICMTVVIPVFANSKNGDRMAAAWILGGALLLVSPLVFTAFKVIPGSPGRFQHCDRRFSVWILVNVFLRRSSVQMDNELDLDLVGATFVIYP